MAEVPTGIVGLPAQAGRRQEQAQRPQDHADQERHGPAQGSPHDLHESDNGHRSHEDAHPEEQGGEKMPFEGTPHHGQVSGQEGEVGSRPSSQRGDPEAEVIGPLGHLRL